MRNFPVWQIVPLLLLIGPFITPATAQTAQPTTLDDPFYAGITDDTSLERAVEQRLARADAWLQQVLAVPGPRTVANTLQPYDRMNSELNAAASLATVMARLHPSEAMRSAAEKLARKVSVAGTDISLRPELYAALRAIPTDGLPADAKQLLSRELRDFRLVGADRPDDVRTRLKQLRADLQLAAQDFNRNLLTGQRAISVSTAELDGLPADFIAARRRDASGMVRITTDDVDVQPVLMYARNAAVRERLQRERWRVATPENIDAMTRLVTIRYQIATTLGFPNWAEYHAQRRMASSAATVATFLERVRTAARPAAEQEYAHLLARKRQDDAAATTLYAWDRTYYGELVKRASYNFDSQQVRPYFPYDRVRAGILDIAARMFDVSFRPVTLPVWHPDVETFEVRRGTQLLGRIYLDIHPRAQKANSGASAATVRGGLAGSQIPEVVLTASVPGGPADQPGLMTHDQVRTVFHEFGHVMHAILGGQGPWAGLNGIQIEPDAAEAPSTMLEEWIWDPATLATFARHYQTGEPIPGSLVEQMRRAGDFGKALDADRQAYLSRISLRLHDRDPRGRDVTAVAAEVSADSVMPWAEGTLVAQFTHLANNLYTSAYYTYLWSRVIAKDLFSKFDRNNLLAPEVAHRYRDTILVPGASKPVDQLITDFLGRPFSFDAWGAWVNDQVGVRP